MSRFVAQHGDCFVRCYVVIVLGDRTNVDQVGLRQSIISFLFGEELCTGRDAIYRQGTQ